jgi:Ca2+-binding EF-hand superfamily protein
LKDWFESKVAPEKKLKSHAQLRSYLEKRYQFPIANHIATILAPRFNNNF